MNMNVKPVSDVAMLCLLFKAGQFIRLKGGENVGRVIEDTEEARGFYTRVQMFDDPDSRWGFEGKANFGPGCLTMWTPDIVLPVAAPSLPPLDIKETYREIFKILCALESIEFMAKTGIAEGSSECLTHIEFVASTFADTTLDIIDELFGQSDVA
jgi:hypothetical protein